MLSTTLITSVSSAWLSSAIGATISLSHPEERRAERIKLIIDLYPHKSGEELAGELIEDLYKDAGDKLTK